MPRRYFDYVAEYAQLNCISTVGSWLILVGFLFGLYTIVNGIRKGAKAPDNPWGAKTLEWQTSSPPIMHNFDHDPIVTAGPYEYK